LAVDGGPKVRTDQFPPWERDPSRPLGRNHGPSSPLVSIRSIPVTALLCHTTRRTRLQLSRRYFARGR
jgi:hypothetical protein